MISRERKKDRQIDGMIIDRFLRSEEAGEKIERNDERFLLEADDKIRTPPLHDDDKDV